MENNLYNQVKTHLYELQKLIVHMSDEAYVYTDQLNDASVGKHIRHTLEIFDLLVAQYDSGVINYEKRQRDAQLELDRDFASQKVTELITSLRRPDKLLILEFEDCQVNTSYHRELLYQLEHIIHHNAILVPLLRQQKELQVSSTFGFAPSTIRHQQKIQ